jgi:hypothetical protein
MGSGLALGSATERVRNRRSGTVSVRAAAFAMAKARSRSRAMASGPAAGSATERDLNQSSETASARVASSVMASGQAALTVDVASLVVPAKINPARALKGAASVPMVSVDFPADLRRLALVLAAPGGLIRFFATWI